MTTYTFRSLVRRPRAAAFAAMLAVSSPGLAAPARAVVDFREHVLPVLERACVSCHRAPYTDTSGRVRGPKAGLRLDARAEMLAAPDLIAAGDAESSLLYELVALPADDPERMPKDAEPLSLREVELLKRWLDEGADFGDWTGEPGEARPAQGGAAAPGAARVALLAGLETGLAAPSAADLAAASGDVATILPVVASGALLEVHFLSREADVGDGDVERLLHVRDHVTVLRAARTGVGDGAARAIAKMPRLTRLDLSATRVGDRAIRDLAGLPELRYLNLRGTAVGDGAVEALATMPRLESVYLLGSKVTDQGAARLAELRPDLYVQRRLDLPTGVLTAPDDDGR